jgi:hypothetical protein
VTSVCLICEAVSHSRGHSGDEAVGKVIMLAGSLWRGHCGGMPFTSSGMPSTSRCRAAQMQGRLGTDPLVLFQARSTAERYRDVRREAAVVGDRLTFATGRCQHNPGRDGPG